MGEKVTKILENKEKSVSYETDKALLADLVQQKEAAYYALVSSYHSTMTRLARAYVGSAAAEEVVQEAWIAVMRSISKFEGRSSLKTWIYRIVINAAKSYLTKAKKAPDTQSYDTTDNIDDYFTQSGWWKWSIQSSALSPDVLLEGWEIKEVLEKKIEKLPKNQQLVLILHDFEGLKDKEICNILELSESNIRVLLHRARSALLHAVAFYQGKAT